MALQAAHRRIVLVVAVASAVVAGVVGGFLLTAGRPGGFLTTSDVGELAALSDVQSKLAPLNICGIDHALRDKRGTRQHRETLFVTPCATVQAYERLVIKVPLRPGVHYELKRASQGERFKVLVEKDDVVFQDLVAALTEHAGILVSTYAAKLEAQRAADQRYQGGVDAQRKAEQERKERAKDSFPAK